MKKWKGKMMAFMYKKMISCEEASFLSSKRQHTRLSFREHVALKLHLVSCDFCRNFEKQIQFIISGAKGMTFDEGLSHLNYKLPPKKKEEIKILIKE